MRCEGSHAPAKSAASEDIVSEDIVPAFKRWLASEGRLAQPWSKRLRASCADRPYRLTDWLFLNR